MTPTARATRRLLAASCLAAAALLAATAAWATRVTFRYQPVIGGVASVAVAGSFNDWNATAHPLADTDKDGVWEAVVDLPAGRIEYKFVVNGDQWFTDESAADFVADPYGGRNSILVLGNDPVVVGHGSTVAKAGAPAGGLRRVTFRFKSAQGRPASVHVAGKFNDWNMSRNALQDADGDGTWETTLLLPSGEYPYKFVVNGSQWVQDKERQDAEVDDNFGGMNSVIRVDARFPEIKTARGDGQIQGEGVAHEQGANEVNSLGGGQVEFTARAHRGDITRLELVTYAGGAERAVPMTVTNQDQLFDYYRATVTLPSGETPYLFRYTDGAAIRYLTSAGLAADPQNRFVWSEQRFPPFTTPEWVKHAVIYQIFPDRFRNGSKANDPDFREWYYAGKNQPPPPGTQLNVEFQEYYHLVRDWNDHKALSEAPHMPKGRDWMAFYGGDIEGVRQSLDYLQDLGVTAIYFNPIFQAKSTHKYDCADYRKIDPHFGTNEEFIAFVREAKARGIRIILDIVYNHAGNAHWAFKEAAEQGAKSPHYSWFEFKRWPLPDGWPNVKHPWKPADYYYCWWGFGDLPDLNFDLSRNNDAEKAVRDVSEAQVNVGLVQHLLDTTEYWLREVDVDGVRLDVPNEVPFWFWKLFNERVKRVKPDAYIVGELWGQASDYVRPGMYDAVMNYAFFRDPVTKFLGMGQGTAAEFDATLAAGRLAYPTQAVQAQMNLIDSHDTVRFLTQVGGNVNRLKLAAMFAMTYVGAPHIYYGDEVGLEGGADPDCRRPFPWNWKSEPKRADLHAYYRKLTAARHAAPALRTGSFRTVRAEGSVFAYARSAGSEDYLVVLNAGRGESAVPIDLAAWGGKVKAQDVLTGARESWSGTATLRVPAETGRLYRIERGASSALER